MSEQRESSCLWRTWIAEAVTAITAALIAVACLAPPGRAATLVPELLAEGGTGGRWSPDGQYVAFARQRWLSAGPGGDPRKVADVWVCRAHLTPSYERNLTEAVDFGEEGWYLGDYQWLPSSRYLLVRYVYYTQEDCQRKTLLFGTTGERLNFRLLDNGRVWVGPFVELSPEDTAALTKLLAPTEQLPSPLAELQLPEGVRAGFPQWAQDYRGCLYLVQQWAGGEPGCSCDQPESVALWLWDAKARKHLRISTDDQPVVTHASWSPDSSLIAYVVTGPPGEPVPASRGLWLWDSSNGKRVRIADQEAWMPMWSSDGSILVYAAREEESRSSLWVWSRSTGAAERKLEVEGRIDSVVRSPSGARMALLVQTSDENRDETEIWVVDTRGGKEPWRIAGREEGILRPGKFVLRGWSPCERYLLAEQHYPARYTCTDLWVFHVEGVPD